jgi:hypothetical protein
MLSRLLLLLPMVKVPSGHGWHVLLLSHPALKNPSLQS